MAKSTTSKSITSSGKKKKGSHRYFCAVPKEFCLGSNVVVSAMLGNHVHKAHGSQEEVAECQNNYQTVILGRERIGANSFRDPKTSEVYLLPRLGKRGHYLRPGKEGARQMPSGKRTGGFIV